MKPEMSVRFAGLLLRNPVIAASGTFGYGVEFEDVVSLDRIGGFITKGLSLEPMAGNQAPRLIETPGGMINAIGLQNIGVKAFIEKKLPLLRPHSGTACIANVFGYEIRDYVGVIEPLNSAPGIAAYELNASCPNTQHGGMVFGTDTGILDQLVTRAKAVSRRPLIVKLSPNVTSIAQMARVQKTPEPTRYPWSTPSCRYQSTSRAAAHGSPTTPAAFQVQQSSPLPCAWSTKPHKRSRFRFAAWAASPPPKTPLNFCWRERPPSRLALPAMLIRGQCSVSQNRWSAGASAIAWPRSKT